MRKAIPLVSLIFLLVAAKSRCILVYDELQEHYMQHVHIPDFHGAESKWKSSLYKPLQEHVASLIQIIGKPSLSFVYIGPGPLAPLFSPGFSQNVRDLIDTILFIDVTEPFVRDAQKIVSGRKSVGFTGDITDGMGQKFNEMILEVLRNDKISGVLKQVKLLDMAATFQNNSLPNLGFKNIDGGSSEVSGDLVYSEMVATFTGTAAMVQFEEKLDSKFGHLSNYNAKKHEIMTALRGQWQEYNTLCFERQLHKMKAMVRVGGVITIATDTEKIFENGQPSILSFTTRDPVFNVDGLKIMETDASEIIWDDSGAGQSSGAHLDAFENHVHRIQTFTYQRIK